MLNFNEHWLHSIRTLNYLWCTFEYNHKQQAEGGATRYSAQVCINSNATQNSSNLKHLAKILTAEWMNEKNCSGNRAEF